MFAGASLDENSGAFCELKANFFRLILTKAEILGLTWDCIDFENGVIKVEKTLCYLPNNGNAIYEFHRPKTLQKMLFVLLGFRKFL